MRLSATIHGALAGLALLATPAAARNLTTDTGDDGTWSYTVSPGCTLNGEFDCNAVDLGFSADFGTGVTSKVYLYDDGLVSFGGKTGSFGAGTVAAMLSKRLSVGFVDPNIYQVGFWQRLTDGVRFYWNDCGSYSPDLTWCGNSDTYLDIVRSADGQNVVITGHGDGSYFSYDGFPSTYELGFPDDSIGLTSREATYGYSLGQQQLALTKLNYDSIWNFQVTLPVASSVPDPATWAMLVIGFGLVGGAMRQRGGRVGHA